MPSSGLIASGIHCYAEVNQKVSIPSSGLIASTIQVRWFNSQRCFNTLKRANCISCGRYEDFGCHAVSIPSSGLIASFHVFKISDTCKSFNTLKRANCILLPRGPLQWWRRFNTLKRANCIEVSFSYTNLEVVSIPSSGLIASAPESHKDKALYVSIPSSGLIASAILHKKYLP